MNDYDLCPDCGQHLEPDGGCMYCPYCGWSGCGVINYVQRLH